MLKTEELIKDEIKDDEYNLFNDENYVLIDNTSAIVARKDKKYGNFTLTHYELKNKKLVKIYEWKQDRFCNNKLIFPCYINDDLFLQYGSDGECLYAIYNYKKGKLIKPKENWDNIFIHNNHKHCNGDRNINEHLNYLDTFNGLLGSFTIEGGSDSIIYFNPLVKMTQEKHIKAKETFFAIINRDGSIKNN